MLLRGLIAGVLLLAGGCTSTLFSTQGEQRKASFEAIAVDRSHAGEALNLDGFVPTFTDTFDHMSVTPEDGKGPWYSPVHAPFAASALVGPGKPEAPVFVINGNLVLQVKQDTTGVYGKPERWVSSLVQTTNKAGDGFGQKYGYFEMRARMDPSLGTWSGLWLHSHPAWTGPNALQAELDIVETYGGDLRGHHAALHLWPSIQRPKNGLQGSADKGAYTKVNGLFNGFHTYGALVTPLYIAFYFDRKELQRMPTPPEFKTRLYLLMDLVLLPKLAGHAKHTMAMDVDEVRVWQNPAWAGL